MPMPRCSGATLTEATPAQRTGLPSQYCRMSCSMAAPAGTPPANAPRNRPSLARSLATCSQLSCCCAE